jgi:uncharacterized membrane protein
MLHVVPIVLLLLMIVIVFVMMVMVMVMLLQLVSWSLLLTMKWMMLPFVANIAKIWLAVNGKVNQIDMLMIKQGQRDMSSITSNEV